jgi:signal-transduction protein with cAMP-binding, CBS, and nucleotidyltransferase domain
MEEPKEIRNEYHEYLAVGEEVAKARIIVDDEIFDRPIRDLHYHPALCIQRTAKLAEAVELMKRHSVGAVMVQDGETLVGIFTERDILRKVIGTGIDFHTTPVETYMTPDPEALTLDDEIAHAIYIMHVGGFRHLPLVDDQHHPVGIVSIKDIVEYVVGFFASDLLNQPPQPRRLYTPRVEGG